MTGRKIAKHAPKVTDITERRREAVELDRLIATHSGLYPLRWCPTPAAPAKPSAPPAD